MNTKTLQSLQNSFIGKVCSIFTPATNRMFSEEYSREHYVIRVTDISTDGIWGSHPGNGKISFFPMSYVISIIEEIELHPDNPEHQKLIQEYEQKSGKKIQSDIPSMQKKEKQEEQQLPFVDILALEKLAAFTKDQYNQLNGKN